MASSAAVLLLAGSVNISLLWSIVLKTRTLPRGAARMPTHRNAAMRVRDERMLFVNDTWKLQRPDVCLLLSGLVDSRV